VGLVGSAQGSDHPREPSRVVPTGHHRPARKADSTFLADTVTVSSWARRGVEMATYPREYKEQLVELHLKRGRSFMDPAASSTCRRPRSRTGCVRHRAGVAAAGVRMTSSAWRGWRRSLLASKKTRHLGNVDPPRGRRTSSGLPPPPQGQARNLKTKVALMCQVLMVSRPDPMTGDHASKKGRATGLAEPSPARGGSAGFTPISPTTGPTSTPGAARRRPPRRPATGSQA
jgi:hypothetical protein